MAKTIYIPTVYPQDLPYFNLELCYAKGPDANEQCGALLAEFMHFATLDSFIRRHNELQDSGLVHEMRQHGLYVLPSR